MPLDPQEIVTLSTEAVELGLAIGNAFKADSPGGKRVTKEEGQALLKKVTQLAADIAREVLD